MNNFYQDSSYKKLLLELDVLGQHSESEIEVTPSTQIHHYPFNLNDIHFEGYDDDEEDLATMTTSSNQFLGDSNNFKHSRSHSDCTGLKQGLPEILIDDMVSGISQKFNQNYISNGDTIDSGKKSTSQNVSPQHYNSSIENPSEIDYNWDHKLYAKIINTGTFFVYFMDI